MNTGNASNGQDPYRRHVDARLEMLSAYVDDEVSPEERKDVEAWLAGDPSTREALAELQDLSVTLRSLPQGVPEPDLAGSILQRIREKTQSSNGDHQVSSPPAVVLQPRTASMFHWRRRELFAATLGAVASLLVVCSLPLATDPGRELSSTGAGNSRGGMLVADKGERETAAWSYAVAESADHYRGLNGAREEKLADKLNVVGSTLLTETQGEAEVRGGASDSPYGTLEVGRPTRMAPGRASVPAEPRDEKTSAKMLSAELNTETNGTPDGNFALSLGTPADKVDESLVQLEPWEQVQPYLGLISKNTTAVTNFDVVVLDVKQAADQFEVLLLQNGIPVVVEGNHSAGLSKLSQQPASTAQPAPSLSVEDPSLTALYIEAEEAPLTNALRELVRQRQVLSLKLQPPLEVQSVADSNEDLPKDGLSDQQTVRADALKLAYGNSLRMVRERDVLARESGSVSALEDLANIPADKELLSSTASLGMQGSPTFANSASRQAGIGTGFGGKLAASSASPAESENLLSNYGQRLQLPQPEPNWLEEVQRRGSQTFSQNDASFNRKLGESIDPTTNSLRAMRREFQAAASNTVRVLFVLQPADGVSSLGSASSDTTAPTTSPAVKSPQER